MAQWLTAEFGLSAEDARVDYNCALRWACANRHPEVARWLVATFGLTPADIDDALDVVAEEDLAELIRISNLTSDAGLDQYVTWLIGA